MSPQNTPRILFLARRYPPSVGGIETHCYNLYRRLAESHPVKLVALGKNALWHLGWFVPYAFLIAFFQVIFRRVEVIYFSDGVICSIAPFLRPLTHARFVVTIYRLGNDLRPSHIEPADALWGLGVRQGGGHQSKDPRSRPARWRAR